MANQRKLGRTADQRKALLRNQVTNLIWNGRITTTEAKAKEVRRIADKMITLAVRECENTVSTTKETHNDEIGPKYKARNAEKNCSGGYTRIYKLGPRRGDAAEMVILELV